MFVVVVYFVIDPVRKLLDTTSYIHASSGIRYWDCRFREIQNSASLRPRGQCNQNCSSVVICLRLHI